MSRFKPSRWSIRSLNNDKAKAPSCQHQTPASRHSRAPRSPPDLESTGQSHATSSLLAGPGQTSSFEIPPQDSHIHILNLSPASNTSVVKDTRDTPEKAKSVSNRFQSIKRFSARIRNKLFSRSHKGDSPSIAPLTQARAHPIETGGAVDTSVPTTEASRSNATLVHTFCVDGETHVTRGADHVVPTPSQGSHETPSPLPPFALKHRQKPVPSPLESSPTRSWYESSASTPSTSTSSISESRYEERALWRQWIKSLNSKNDKVVTCDEHKIIAIGTALYDWDGVIPGRQTRGIDLKEGHDVHICNVINDSWLHAHVNEVDCMFLPREFVRINRFNDDRGRRLLGRYLEVPNTPTAHHTNFFGESLPMSRVDKLLALWRRAPGVHGQKEHIPGKQRPDVPPPPFPREPNDAVHQGNRVMVDTECRYPKDHSGVIITFTFTLVPALRSRLTSLWFNVKLPGGQKIIGVYPEHVVGQQTDVQHNASRSRELALKASASHAGVGIDLAYEESRVQEVEYSRTVKAEILGAGRNSDNATWTASEDVAARSGLENKMKFSIMLQTRTPPPKVTCQYMFGFEKEAALEANHRSQGSFDHNWEVSFLSGPQGSTASERHHPRQRLRPFYY